MTEKTFGKVKATVFRWDEILTPDGHLVRKSFCFAGNVIIAAKNPEKLAALKKIFTEINIRAIPVDPSKQGSIDIIILNAKEFFLGSKYKLFVNEEG